jgi:phosphoesterase RecJ-like protein
VFNEVISKIKSSKRIAIFNHINPDGDAHGSAFGLKAALLAIGKQAEVFLREGDNLTKEFKLAIGTDPQGLEIKDCDLKIAVDCADVERLGIFAKDFTGETIAIDHHVTHKSFAKTTLVVPSAPATGEIIFDLIEKMNIGLTYDIAYNLYMAIVCDTGIFKFSSTTPHTHIVAAKLMETGIPFADMSKKLFDTKTFEYLQMYKKSIESLEMYHDGKIALLAFYEKDFEEAGISEADADGIVNLPNSIVGAEVGVYIRERANGFKISLRSGGKLDVAKIASDFGGGGHERASGFSLDMPLDELKKVVVDKLAEAIANGDKI